MSGTWRMVLLPPVLVTWAVILIRLGGELLGGPSWLFSRQQGGGGALVGITWLVLVFGAWFGWRLAKDGKGPDRPVLALLLHLVSLGAGIGGMAAAQATGIIDFKKPGLDIGYCFFVVLGTSSLVMLWSWKSLFLANLLYAALARLGVVLVTIPATLCSWDTHFSKLGPEGLQAATWEQVARLSGAQVFFWIPFTVLVGGVFGSIAGVFAGGRRPASVQPDQPGAAGVVGGGDV